MTSGDLPVHRYRSAGGVVADRTGQRVLVLNRPARLGPDGRPEVRLPKGHIREGESREACAQREVAEESGLAELEILADLGERHVEFDWQGQRIMRKECYFLMRLPGPRSVPRRLGESQFEPEWLPWEQALAQLTFEAEREAVRRAWEAWQARDWSQDG
jgi:8-oxo-dGTP pyrophosphatase MutT (NUDIX family)